MSMTRERRGKLERREGQGQGFTETDGDRDDRERQRGRERQRERDRDDNRKTESSRGPKANIRGRMSFPRALAPPAPRPAFFMRGPPIVVQIIVTSWMRC